MSIGLPELFILFTIGIILIVIPTLVIVAAVYLNNRLNKLETRLAALEQRHREIAPASD